MRHADEAEPNPKPEAGHDTLLYEGLKAGGRSSSSGALLAQHGHGIGTSVDGDVTIFTRWWCDAEISAVSSDDGKLNI